DKNIKNKGDLMILNWEKEMKAIDPDMNFRMSGGWLKTIEKLDKSVKNGYSLVGDFVKSGNFEVDYDEGLYLDCNKEGKKAKQQDYRLFRLKDGKLRLLDMVIDGKGTWAVDLWDAIEDEIRNEK
ncbi:MAG: hypothetical protein LBM96_06120, partial [Methanobrevibacter sp.]|nr:hypothetical protein [Candidatus Methanoflexus mossambicus]